MSACFRPFQDPPTYVSINNYPTHLFAQFMDGPLLSFSLSLVVWYTYSKYLLIMKDWNILSFLRDRIFFTALESEGKSALFSLLQNIDFIVYVCFYFSSIGWRHGLQAVTGVVFLTFVLGTFYRSASLYHPQRRAILHLKSQKRKIKSKDKEKNKIQDDTPPFFDFTTLKSRTVQLLLLSVGVGSFGLNSPIFYLVSQMSVFG